MAPTGGVVRLVFGSFDTESGYDEVQVHDGCTGNDSLIKSYSGDKLPTPISSTGNVLHIIFNI